MAQMKHQAGVLVHPVKLITLMKRVTMMSKQKPALEMAQEMKKEK